MRDRDGASARGEEHVNGSVSSMPEKTSSRSTSRDLYVSVIEQCRDTVQVFCDAHLVELLQNANAALLEFAERAESNSVQTRFFEAMGQLGRRRAEIEQVFRREIDLGFDRLGKPGRAAQDNPAPPPVQGLELSLVEPEDMEESVAAENLVLRANAAYFPELYALSQRLAVVKGSKKLKDHEIPAGPNHLVQSFREAIDVLDVEVRVKVILYALFDKFLLKKVRTTYDEYNALLIGAGVLPNLKPVRVRSDQAGSAKGRAAKSADRGPSPTEDSAEAPTSDADGQPTPPSLGAELFETILELMSSRRSSSGGRATARHAELPIEEAQEQTHKLLTAITSLQAAHGSQLVYTAVAEAVQFPSVEVDTAFLSRVKEALSQERAKVLDAADRDKLSPMDADLIDLIGMLFEYMLNDPVLPNIAKALLSHLHTPYLKVALIDRRLLVDSRHPARRLLDQMVDAGSQWIEEGNPSRGMFPVMQNVVDRVLQELADDIALFEELLEFFEEKMREQQRRSDTMEQRTQDAARGREKLALAKQRAVREIQDLTARYAIPKQVTTFLGKVWLDHLVFILLRDAEQERSSAWKGSVALAEQLIGLFDPQVGAETRRARVAAAPRLRDELASTARRMGTLNAGAVDELVALLDAPQLWATQQLEQVRSPIPTGTEIAASSGLPPPLGVATASEDDKDLSEPERQMVERLRKMRFGTWFELDGPSGTAPRRIKLSWISPFTSTCMFVDRSGMQAEVKSLKDLAQEILSGHARVIPRPKHPFIDRALVSIRRMLQRDPGETANEEAERVS